MNIEVYCDEAYPDLLSSQKPPAQYLVVGSLWLQSEKRSVYKESIIRAERVDWIKAALKDPHSERFIGWDSKRKRYDRKRRVTLVMGNYIVVIELTLAGTGIFKTAFVADSEKTLKLIRQGPRWA